MVLVLRGHILKNLPRGSSSLLNWVSSYLVSNFVAFNSFTPAIHVQPGMPYQNTMINTFLIF